MNTQPLSRELNKEITPNSEIDLVEAFKVSQEDPNNPNFRIFGIMLGDEYPPPQNFLEWKINSEPQAKEYNLHLRVLEFTGLPIQVLCIFPSSLEKENR